MELKDVILSRRSIRKFKPDPVPDDYIREILEAARLAPSGSNLQPSRFVVVKDPEVRRQLSTATLKFVTTAPVVIACCADLSATETRMQRVAELAAAGAFAGTDLETMDPNEYAERRQMDEHTARSYLSLNTAIAIEHLILRATDLGLGTCWIMMFKPKEVKQILGLNDNLAVVALVPVGFPAQSPAPRPRLPMEQILIKEI